MLTELIQKRQSIRNYLLDPVPRELIEDCLEAARLAPSACNSQPWHFIVVDNPDLKNTICDVIFSGPYCINIFAKQAPVLIVVISEQSAFLTKVGGFLRGTPYYLMDIGIAVEHLILQAQELGLGTCWIGWFNEKALKKILQIPSNRKIPCLVSVGYSNESLREKQRNPLEKIFSYNSYRNV